MSEGFLNPHISNQPEKISLSITCEGFVSYHLSKSKKQGHSSSWMTKFCSNYLDFVEYIGFNVDGEVIFNLVIKVKYVFMENKNDKI